MKGKKKKICRETTTLINFNGEHNFGPFTRDILCCVFFCWFPLSAWLVGWQAGKQNVCLRRVNKRRMSGEEL